jgi:hypothetical protein
MGLTGRTRFSAPAWAESPPERRKQFRGLSEMLEFDTPAWPTSIL